MTIRSYRHIEVRPIAGALGAEIHGVDVSRALASDAPDRKTASDRRVTAVRREFEGQPSRYTIRTADQTADQTKAR
jgi:hypothetical protein